MRVWIVALVLIATLACSSVDEPDFVVPTPGLFEVLTATPFPTATPVPSPTPTVTPTPSPVPPPPLPFPNHIDPDRVSVRPTDEEILIGWTEFLTNAQWNYEALDGSIITQHLCSDGSVYFTDFLDGRGQDWQVILNPAMSANTWSQVLVEVRVSEFQSRTLLTLKIEDGEILNYDEPIEFQRSQRCGDL